MSDDRAPNNHGYDQTIVLPAEAIEDPFSAVTEARLAGREPTPEEMAEALRRMREREWLPR
jgi:hypothetical protein